MQIEAGAPQALEPVNDEPMLTGEVAQESGRAPAPTPSPTPTTPLPAVLQDARNIITEFTDILAAPEDKYRLDAFRVKAERLAHRMVAAGYAKEARDFGNSLVRRVKHTKAMEWGFAGATAHYVAAQSVLKYQPALALIHLEGIYNLTSPAAGTELLLFAACLSLVNCYNSQGRFTDADSVITRFRTKFAIKEIIPNYKPLTAAEADTLCGLGNFQAAIAILSGEWTPEERRAIVYAQAWLYDKRNDSKVKALGSFARANKTLPNSRDYYDLAKSTAQLSNLLFAALFKLHTQHVEDKANSPYAAAVEAFTAIVKQQDKQQIIALYPNNPLLLPEMRAAFAEVGVMHVSSHFLATYGHGVAKAKMLIKQRAQDKIYAETAVKLEQIANEAISYKSDSLRLCIAFRQAYCPEANQAKNVQAALEIKKFLEENYIPIIEADGKISLADYVSCLSKAADPATLKDKFPAAAGSAGGVRDEPAAPALIAPPPAIKVVTSHHRAPSVELQSAPATPPIVAKLEQSSPLERIGQSVQFRPHGPFAISTTLKRPPESNPSATTTSPAKVVTFTVGSLI